MRDLTLNKDSDHFVDTTNMINGGILCRKMALFSEDCCHIFPAKEVPRMIGWRFRSVTALLVLVSLVALFVTACGETPTTAPPSQEIQETTPETTQPQTEQSTITEPTPSQEQATTKATPPAPAVTTSKPAPPPVVEKQEVTVYVTRTGAKYHRSGCRYLARSCIPISLEDAKASGYGPCSVCGPPL